MSADEPTAWQPNPEEEKSKLREMLKGFVALEEAWLEDDPGRQFVGSFKPITTDDWYAQAYGAGEAGGSGADGGDGDDGGDDGGDEGGDDGGDDGGDGFDESVRLEFVQGKSSKFWSITRSGADTVVTYGKVIRHRWCASLSSI